MKESDILYSFQLEKEIEKEIEEEREENGEKFTIKKKVKEKVPVTFYLKRPTRRERDDADMFYAASFGKAVDFGLLPRALLDKRFKDSGGELNNKDRENYDDLIMELVEAENEVARLSSDRDKNKTKINKLSKQIVLIRKKIVNIQTYTNILYKDTADSKAEAKTILWLLLYLMNWKDYDAEGITPVFTGKTHEEKLDSYDEIYDTEDDTLKEAIGKMTSFVTLLYMGVAKDKKDFEYYEKEMEKDNLS